MKQRLLINSGISSENEVPLLLSAGARLFYAGVLFDTKQIGVGDTGTNRRSFEKANLSDLDNLFRIKEMLTKKGAKIALTLNSLYDDSLLKYIQDVIFLLAEKDFRSIIVSDMGLIYWLFQNQLGFDTHASSLMVINNKDTIRLLGQFGITKFIFPRHLSIPEIRGIIGNDDADKFEVFIFGTRCFFEDGHCGFQHGIGGRGKTPLLEKIKYKIMPDSFIIRRLIHFTENAPSYQRGCDLFRCKNEVSVQGIETQDTFRPCQASDLMSGFHFQMACGACALYHFSRMGIGSVKIVNRISSTYLKVKEVEFINDAIAGLDMHLNYESYSNACRRLYKKHFGIKCKPSFCYYPQISP